MQIFTKMLVIGAAMELLTNRTLSRLAAFIPSSQALQVGWSVIDNLGLMALYLTFFLVITLTFFTALGFLGWGGTVRLRSPVLGALILVLVCGVVAATVAPGAWGERFWLPLFTMAAASMICIKDIFPRWAADPHGSPNQLWSVTTRTYRMSAMGGMFMVALVGGNIIALASNLVLLPPGQFLIFLYRLGELSFVFLPPVFLLAAFRPRSRKPWSARALRAGLPGLVAALAGLGGVIFVFLDREVASMLAIWSLGLPLAWPAVFYLPGIMVLVYLYLGGGKEGIPYGQRQGLLLWAMAGYTYTTEYQYLLMLSGLLLFYEGLDSDPLKGLIRRKKNGSPNLGELYWLYRLCQGMPSRVYPRRSQSGA